MFTSLHSFCSLSLYISLCFWHNHAQLTLSTLFRTFLDIFNRLYQPIFRSIIQLLLADKRIFPSSLSFPFAKICHGTCLSHISPNLIISQIQYKNKCTLCSNLNRHRVHAFIIAMDQHRFACLHLIGYRHDFCRFFVHHSLRYFRFGPFSLSQVLTSNVVLIHAFSYLISYRKINSVWAAQPFHLIIINNFRYMPNFNLQFLTN